MDKAEFDKIKAHAADCAHAAFQYAEYEELTDYQLVVESDELILLRGYNHEAHTDQYLWAANTADALANALSAKGPYLLTFVPPAWVPALEAARLTIRNVWHDYFRPNLDDIREDPQTKFDFLNVDNFQAASEVTLQCRGQSRGFTGQTPEWFRQWLVVNDDVKHPAILAWHLPDGELAGVLCTGLYGGKQEGGPIVFSFWFLPIMQSEASSLRPVGSL